MAGPLLRSGSTQVGRLLRFQEATPQPRSLSLSRKLSLSSNRAPSCRSASAAISTPNSWLLSLVRLLQRIGLQIADCRLQNPSISIPGMSVIDHGDIVTHPLGLDEIITHEDVSAVDLELNL